MKVFVYGSLRRGFGNHGLLARSRFVREASTPPVYRMHSLGYFPGVCAGGDQSIVGEVYDVDAFTLADLDRLEGHPRFYRRTRITLADGERVWTYLLPEDLLARRPVVASGDWKDRTEART